MYTYKFTHMENKKILIVEDETDIREALGDIFTMNNFTVTTAVNGQEGLKLALETHPDIILLDLMMPVMNGHEVLQHLRQDPWGKDVTVVVLSALDDVKNIGTAHKNEITKYIIKAHVSLDEIVNKVREAVFGPQ